MMKCFLIWIPSKQKTLKGESKSTCKYILDKEKNAYFSRLISNSMHESMGSSQYGFIYCTKPPKTFYKCFICPINMPVDFNAAE